MGGSERATHPGGMGQWKWSLSLINRVPPLTAAAGYTRIRSRPERCELWGYTRGRVVVQSSGDPTLAACTLRDHPAGSEAYSGCGVYVKADSKGKATVGADCVFARNAMGNVVRA